MKEISSIENSFLKSDIKKFIIKTEPEEVKNIQTDSMELSDVSKILNKIDGFFNLSKKRDFSLNDLNKTEKEEFFKILASLLKNGFVGYEVLEVDGMPEKHDIVLQIGNKRIRGAKPYRKNDINELM